MELWNIAFKVLLLGVFHLILALLSWRQMTKVGIDNEILFSPLTHTHVRESERMSGSVRDFILIIISPLSLL
jgi:hypothetical protein